MSVPRAPSRLVVLLAMGVASSVAAPASGRVTEHEHVRGVDTHIEQVAHGDDFCPDVPFLVEFSAVFGEHRLERVKGSGSFPHFTSNYQARESYTNVENGKALHLRTSVNGGDRRIVDNGDGTITIHLALTGRTVTYGPDGARLYLETGRFHAVIVIDVNGTPANLEDDTEVSFEVLRDTGRNDTAQQDFCADLVTFLS